jgi:outer membrane protein OmpA-like peptidoglycan-associated protein
MRRIAPLCLIPLAIALIAASSHPMEVRDAERVLLTGDIKFKTNSAELLPISEIGLAKVAAAIHKIPAERRVRIGVHSDMRGSDTYNLAMSQQRATSVARWLVEHGVPCARLVPVGFGELRPLSKKQQPYNRRVEITSLSAAADAADGGALGQWSCPALKAP